MFGSAFRYTLHMMQVSSAIKNLVFKRSAILIAVICLLNAPAMLFYWYSTIWWFDILMHFLGGFFVAVLFFWIFASFVPETWSPKTQLGVLGALLLSVFIIGLAWEGYELVIDLLTGAKDYVYLDGFSDMFNDLAGGVFGFLTLVPFLTETKE